MISTDTLINLAELALMCGRPLTKDLRDQLIARSVDVRALERRYGR